MYIFNYTYFYIKLVKFLPVLFARPFCSVHKTNRVNCRDVPAIQRLSSHPFKCKHGCPKRTSETEAYILVLFTAITNGLTTTQICGYVQQNIGSFQQYLAECVIAHRKFCTSNLINELSRNRFRVQLSAATKFEQLLDLQCTFKGRVLLAFCGYIRPHISRTKCRSKQIQICQTVYSINYNKSTILQSLLFVMRVRHSFSKHSEYANFYFLMIALYNLTCKIFTAILKISNYVISNPDAILSEISGNEVQYLLMLSQICKYYILMLISTQFSKKNTSPTEKFTNTLATLPQLQLAFYSPVPKL